MNKKGNAGLGMMTGLMVGVMCLFMFSALLPAVISMLGTGKGSNSANCQGYTDPNGLYSYNSSRATDSITCSILNFSPGMWVLSVIFAIIAGVISGRFANDFGGGQQQQVQQYQGY